MNTVTRWFAWTEDRERAPGDLLAGTAYKTPEEARAEIVEIAGRVYDSDEYSIEDDIPETYEDAVDMLAHWCHIGAGVAELEVTL